MDVRHRKQLSLSLFMCRSHCKTTETMGLQYLISLIFLAQPFLIQSGFQQHQSILCDYETNETTIACLQDDSCSWKVDLLTCSTLQMYCIENDVLRAESFCSSSKDCGFQETFPDYLNGLLNCKVTKVNNKYGIECVLDVACGNEKHVCATPKACHWNPSQQFMDINDARCTLKHDVSQCIKAHPKWNLTEQLNCTITPAEQNNGSEIRGYSRMEKDQSCDNTTTDTLNPGCISSIAINGILLLAMFVVICIKLKRAQNNQNQPPGATQLEELQTLQGGQSNSTQARSDV
ncbi:uncharacterized protein LOC108441373 isoform X1 [Pygocentrus nattereri]|uniref:uncharacterized protein LOC108441373 isoform X1 n=1 Tax=Pygocentrus nattereri TaxID=42514 RepID=UPI00081495FE|nr:uncharacterized protein LOC108441373 isoform X1 [Pygocentrus nattereri]